MPVSDVEPPRPVVLPDVLAAGLDILFCGTAAGAASAAQRAYYAGLGNAFWPTLFAVGLTPRLVEPRDYAQVAGWNLGFTDLVKHASGSDDVLERDHFEAARVRHLIETLQPRIVAFTSKRAAGEFLGRTVGYGLLDEMVGTVRLFVLPSPSGAARRYWDQNVWRDLALLRSAPR